MAICPKDLLPCIDDLCYGSGCMQLGGEPMVAVDGSDNDDCECDPEDYEDDPMDYPEQTQ